MLYRFLVRRTESKFNAVIFKRSFMSRINKTPMSVSRLIHFMKGKESNIPLLVGTVADHSRIYQVSAMPFTALRFTETAIDRVDKAGDEGSTFDQLARIAAPGQNTANAHDRVCNDNDFFSEDESIGANRVLIKFLMDKGYPLYKNWSDQYDMFPYDQGELGICLQVSCLGAVENSLIITNKAEIPLSLEDLVLYTHIDFPRSQDEKSMNSNREGNRARLGQLDQFMKDYGLLSVDGKYRVKVGSIEMYDDLELLFSVLQKGTALSPIYSSGNFQEVREEIFSGDEGGCTSGSDNVDDDFECVPGWTTNHIVEIVGYNVPLDAEPYAIVRNTYGRVWGEEGIGKIYFGVNGFGYVFWVLTDISVVESSSVVPQLIPVKKSFCNTDSGEQQYISVKPLGDNVLVQIKPVELTITGVAEAGKDKPSFGTVIAVGPGLIDEEGNRKPLTITTGNTLQFSECAENYLKGSDGSEYIVLRASDVMAVQS